MYPYSRSVSPAAKSHLEAQLSFFNGISKSLFRSVQQFSELNLQFAQGLLEESTIAGQHLISVDRDQMLASNRGLFQQALRKLQIQLTELLYRTEQRFRDTVKKRQLRFQMAFGSRADTR